MSDRDAKQKAGIRRTTLILIGVALAFYLGFIALGVLR
jgi:hypothetical protein